MDLDVVMKSADCHFIVQFYGAIFKEGDCWICMQLMSTSTDKFYKFIYDNLKESIPEKVREPRAIDMGRISCCSAFR